MAVKKVIHIISSLGIGGAETLLVNTVNGMKGIDHVVLYLADPDTLKNAFNKNVKLICLNHKKGLGCLRTLYKIGQIIKKEKPDLVHAHLLWPMLYSRLALPKNVRLVSTIHTPLSVDAYQHNPLIRKLDRWLHTKNERIIAVSKSVLDDYDREIKIKGSSSILYNFVNDAFFESRWAPRDSLQYPIKLVAVGNLRASKNHGFLIHSLARLPRGMFQLDIFGTGDLQRELQALINKSGVDVNLKGKVSNIEKLLVNYDAYIMSSTLEGHSIAVAEAMAVGIPMILSRIPTLVEGAFGYAHFFDLSNVDALVNILHDFKKEYDLMLGNAVKAREIAYANYRKDVYIDRLKALYNDR